MSVPSFTSPPSIWVSHLAQILAGSAHCRWAAWFRARSRYDRLPSSFDSTGWQVQHTSMLAAFNSSLRTDGYTVTLEQQNRFCLTSHGISVAGKPDLVAVRGSEALVVDCKTGSPQPQHAVQVMLYLLLLPHQFQELAGVHLDGMLHYSDHQVVIPAESVDDTFRETFRLAVHEIGGDMPPRRVPSISECHFCNIGPADCPNRLDGTTAEVQVDAALF